MLFWSHFCHLGVTFGALWLHFLCKKTDWGAKGATRGAKEENPEIKSPILTPFGGHFLYIFTFFSKNNVFKYVFFKLCFYCVFGAV
jgi:hypothetical protein